MECSSHQVRSVVGSLPFFQSICDLLPLRVARECDEQGGLGEVTDQRHAIHVQLVHVPRSTGETGREDHTTTDGGAIGVSLLNRIGNAAVQFGAEHVLVAPVPPHALRLDATIHV
jgi:hypothetical protein